MTLLTQIGTSGIKDNAITTAKVAADAVTQPKIGAGAVGTTEIADNAVLTGKIQDGTLTTADLTDNAVSNAKIATGISSSKLTGALPALDGSALTGVEGNLVLLNTTTISSATAEVAFTNLFDDAYETFIIRGTEITSNASSDQDYFRVRKARGGSTTYDTDATYGTKVNTTSNANSNYTVNGGFSETNWLMTPSGYLDSTEAVPLQFQMTLPDPKGTTAGGRAFNFFLTYYSYHPYYITSHGTLWSTNNNVTGIKFFFSNNSILTGTFKLYGVK